MTIYEQQYADQKKSSQLAGFVTFEVSNLNVNMLEKECDDVLDNLHKNRLFEGDGWLFGHLKQNFPNYSQQLLEDVLSVLVTEGMLETPNDDGIPSYRNSVCYFIISAKGIAFYNSDSFFDRAKRWDLEKKLKTLDYALKKRTFGIAVAGLLISLLSFGLTVSKYMKEKASSENNKSNSNPKRPVNN